MVLVAMLLAAASGVYFVTRLIEFARVVRDAARREKEEQALRSPLIGRVAEWHAPDLLESQVRVSTFYYWTQEGSVQRRFPPQLPEASGPGFVRLVGDGHDAHMASRQR